jgi:hypothetical protein
MLDYLRHRECIIGGLSGFVNYCRRSSAGFPEERGETAVIASRDSKPRKPDFLQDTLQDTRTTCGIHKPAPDFAPLRAPQAGCTLLVECGHSVDEGMAQRRLRHVVLRQSRCH